MLDQSILRELQEYIDLHTETVVFKLSEPNFSFSEQLQQTELELFIKEKRKPTFSQLLFSYIDKQGVSDSDLYKKACIDRRHFSKIRSNPDYRPKKSTVLALALALELTENEVNELLSSAGYDLSDSDTFDLVIQFCLEKKIYNLDDVNEALEYFQLKPLI